MWQRLRLRVMCIAFYPLNLATIAAYGALLVFSSASTIEAVLGAVTLGSAYEFVCRRVGRRVLWPFDTAGARMFRETQLTLADLRAQNREHKVRLEQARAENRRLTMLQTALREGRFDKLESVTHDIRVDVVERTDTSLIVTFRGGPAGHLDMFIDGERHRMLFSALDEPYDDPVHEARRQQLVAEREEQEVHRYKLPATAEAVMFLDDLAEGDGTLWWVLTPGVGTSLELADKDRRRIFGLERH